MATVPVYLFFETDQTSTSHDTRTKARATSVSAKTNTSTTVDVRTRSRALHRGPGSPRGRAECTVLPRRAASVPSVRHARNAAAPGGCCVRGLEPVDKANTKASRHPQLGFLRLRSSSRGGGWRWLGKRGLGDEDEDWRLNWFSLGGGGFGVSSKFFSRMRMRKRGGCAGCFQLL